MSRPHIAMTNFYGSDDWSNRGTIERTGGAVPHAVKHVLKTRPLIKMAHFLEPVSIESKKKLIADDVPMRARKKSQQPAQKAKVIPAKKRVAKVGKLVTIPKKTGPKPYTKGIGFDTFFRREMKDRTSGKSKGLKEDWEEGRIDGGMYWYRVMKREVIEQWEKLTGKRLPSNHKIPGE